MQLYREEDGSFFINQEQKIKDLISFMNMEDAYAVATPMEPSYVKDQDDPEKLPTDNKYHVAIGKLLYVSTLTRPDISAAMGLLCRKSSAPTFKDWNAVKRLVRYLKGTAHFKLKLPANSKLKLIVYTDTNKGEALNTRLTSEHTFFYGNGMISWTSQKQESVAQSPTEAEYISAGLCC
ncbi:uncharacterized protein LOC129326256 [Eublepharis macularius]|uniref:Uncharacterized protein LOC129326256 n=1 Tax=Eublepharis macularius TaxID=481883 RepID=A0AA97J309_EUBMA|nr:uncharacterized protein LOC129326256 [Eublepharis macularius]